MRQYVPNRFIPTGMATVYFDCDVTIRKKTQKKREARRGKKKPAYMTSQQENLCVVWGRNQNDLSLSLFLFSYATLFSPHTTSNIL
jgi:hypothetical protein